MPQVSTLQPLDEIPYVHICRKGSLRCTAFALKDKSLCLWSPVAGLAKTLNSELAEIGPVKFILAPNYYHNKALAEFHKEFPKAKLCAPPKAQERLQKVTGFKFAALDTLKAQLPKHLSIVEPKGLKNGEIWIRSNYKKQISWFVVDALSGDKMTASKDRGAGISMMKTFPNYGIEDASIYAAWALKQLSKDQPTLVVPCHGAIAASDRLPSNIKKILGSL